MLSFTFAWDRRHWSNLRPPKIFCLSPYPQLPKFQLSILALTSSPHSHSPLYSSPLTPLINTDLSHLNASPHRPSPPKPPRPPPRNNPPPRPIYTPLLPPLLTFSPPPVVTTAPPAPPNNAAYLLPHTHEWLRSSTYGRYGGSLRREGGDIDVGRE
jgi:hypothetical protein